MYTLSSRLTSQEREFADARRALAEQGFMLGGNWDYDRGSFDCPLDGERQVWLRLPFDMTAGRLDGETEPAGARIRFGQPYVLRHVYNDGLDPEARARTFGGMLDQFQDPVEADAELDDRWIDTAARKLREAEAACLS